MIGSSGIETTVIESLMRHAQESENKNPLPDQPAAEDVQRFEREMTPRVGAGEPGEMSGHRLGPVPMYPGAAAPSDPGGGQRPLSLTNAVDEMTGKLDHLNAQLGAEWSQIKGILAEGQFGPRQMMKLQFLLTKASFNLNLAVKVASRFNKGASTLFSGTPQ